MAIAGLHFPWKQLSLFSTCTRFPVTVVDDSFPFPIGGFFYYILTLNISGQTMKALIKQHHKRS
jgi:hypothetical protein